MTMVTLRWEDASAASQIVYRLAGEDYEALSSELAAAVAGGFGGQFIEVRLDVAKHVFFKLQGYSSGLKDKNEWGRLDYCKQQVRKALRGVGYNI